MRKPDMQGKLTAKQLQSLADVLAHAQVDKLPPTMGKFLGANPHVVTLSWGKRQCEWTLPTGSPVPNYPDQPFGKLTLQDSFAEISQILRKMCGNWVRGTTPSWVQKLELNLPIAPNARLRHFQSSCLSFSVAASWTSRAPF